MKALSFIIVIVLLSASNSFSQKTRYTERTHETRTSLKKVRKDSSDVTAILKDSANAETGPILNDNGSVSTTGTIDGRSSTGRPDAEPTQTDTTTTYTVKKTIRTLNPGETVKPDSSKKRKKP
ncbi:hypothetical protein [Dyadobacter sp. CY323]|uniref:hypothetical protein n=1 Tax=Dyadobacter sp. CY323 TaxID=2907302 RepID=UPI001F3DF7D6|nr:hypothetical protein [Dyadobacter sp. CY323]MCE6987615.1 hypothetical protein [Dyadobacter sp. CY323]